VSVAVVTSYGAVLTLLTVQDLAGN